MKHFNTTGVCLLDQHYMVDITERVENIHNKLKAACGMKLIDNAAVIIAKKNRT